MGRVKSESVGRGELGGNGIEHVDREVDHDPADPALRVRVRLRVVDQMVCGGPVTQVNVLDDAEVAERLESAINAGLMYAARSPRGLASGDEDEDFVGAQVPGGGRHRVQDGPALAGHTLPAGTQPFVDRGDELLGVSTLRGVH